MIIACLNFFFFKLQKVKSETVAMAVVFWIMCTPQHPLLATDPSNIIVGTKVHCMTDATNTNNIMGVMFPI